MAPYGTTKPPPLSQPRQQYKCSCINMRSLAVGELPAVRCGTAIYRRTHRFAVIRGVKAVLECCPPPNQ